MTCFPGTDALIVSKHVPVRGHASRVRVYPGQTWGRNPAGGPLYRVIWSESRQYMIGGRWPDGSVEYRWVPYYFGRKEWMLEKWLRPEEYGGTERMWEGENIDRELAMEGYVIYRLGPYPSQGWYDHCYSFPSDGPPNLEAIVPLLEATKNLTFQQIKDGIRLYHERQRKEWDRKVEDGIREALPAFGNAATNLNPAKPTGDSPGLLSHPHELRKTVQNYLGKKTSDTPEFTDLRPRGVSMGQRKG